MASWERIPDFEAGREEWGRLAELSRNVFASWEWANVWWRHFGEGEPLLLRGVDVPAILPLCLSRRGPLRLVRFIGHGAGDVLGPVCAPADREAAGAVLLEALHAGETPSWDVLLAERLPGGPLGEAVGGARLQRESCPELDTAGRGWEEFLASCSRNMREKLRRNTRKLEREHKLSFRLCASAEQLGPDFETLLRLHRERWGEGTTQFQTEAVQAFHRELAAEALERGWLRLWTMEVDGEPVAAWYGFRFAGVESFYQSGRDRRFDRHSAGFLLLMHTVRAAFEDGLDRYAFLRGDEPYKARLADADPGLETRAIGRGPLGATAVRAGALALRSPRLRHRAARALR